VSWIFVDLQKRVARLNGVKTELDKVPKKDRESTRPAVAKGSCWLESPYHSPTKEWRGWEKIGERRGLGGHNGPSKDGGNSWSGVCGKGHPGDDGLQRGLMPTGGKQGGHSYWRDVA